MSEQEQANHYEPDENGLCKHAGRNSPCAFCIYRPERHKESMTTEQRIRYLKQTKGVTARCHRGEVVTMIACTSKDLATHRW